MIVPHLGLMEPFNGFVLIAPFLFFKRVETFLLHFWRNNTKPLKRFQKESALDHRAKAGVNEAALYW